jgi:hypothetical protein
MGQQKRPEGRSARDRVAAERDAQRRKGLRRRRLIVAGTVAAVIAAAVGIGIATSSSSSKPTAYTPPSGGSVVADKYANPANKDTALAYGPASAPHTLTIF